MVRKRRNTRAMRRVVRGVRAARASVLGGGTLRAYAFGHAFGIVSIIALLFYAVMVWFGSYDGSIIINQYPLGFSFNSWTLIIGLIETYVLSYIGGWIFAKVYNRALRRSW